MLDVTAMLLAFVIALDLFSLVLNFLGEVLVLLLVWVAFMFDLAAMCPVVRFAATAVLSNLALR